MMDEKENNFAFQNEGKESIEERLRKLIGNRSVRAAAKDWGLSFSTLNNYLTRGTEPSLNVAVKISHVEHVTIEWLATGMDNPFTQKKMDEQTLSNSSDLDRRLTELLSFLRDNEKQELIESLIRKGIETILYLLDEDNIKLLQLDRVVKAKILGLQSNAAASLNDERAKECGSDSEIGAASTSLTGGHKQAV